MTARYRIACLQTRPRADFESAAAEALRLAKEAVDGGAQLIALPEYCGGLRMEEGRLAPPSAPEESHPVLADLRGFAASAGVWTLVGSVAVDGPDGRLLNRCFVLDGSGEIVARYDKIHMFDIQLSEREWYRESATVSPGSVGVIADTDFGRMGLSICYDLRFPGLYRGMAQIGAEILAVPAAFTKTTGMAHWHALNRARAIENGCFVFAPGATGKVAGGGETYGHSLVVNPWGEVLADGGESAGVVAAEIDLAEVESARSRIPSLKHDWPYEILNRLGDPESA